MLQPGRHGDSGSYRYGFGGHEKDDEMKGDGNHYTFEGYGLDVRTGRRFQIDPLIGKFPSQSAYMTFFNNPISFIDPTGMGPTDVRIEGEESEEAFNELEESVCNELNLNMDNNTGLVSYTRLNPDEPLSSEAQKLVNAIDDHSVVVNLLARDTKFTETGNTYQGGAFSGNTFVKTGIDNYKMVFTKQEVNPNFLKAFSQAQNKPGQDILHEVSESYDGGLYALKWESSTPSSAIDQRPYKLLHGSTIVKQSTDKDIHSRFFDASENIVRSGSWARWEVYTHDVDTGQEVILQTTTIEEYNKAKGN